MSDTKKPPAFYCPACGQKHRTNLDNLLQNPGSVMHLACVGCAKPLALTLDDDHLPVCTLHEADAAPTPTKAPAPEKKRGGAPVASSKRKKAGNAPAPTRKKKDRKKGKPTAETTPEAESPAADEESPAPEEPAKVDTDEPETKDVPDAPVIADAEFGPEDRIGRYTIEKAIGQGGTSTVYRAFDPTTNRSVAVKVLNQDQSDIMRQRFLREIEVQANIRHQNIMPVFDRGELVDGRPFFTMELLYRPWTLAEIIQRREEGRLSRYATLRKLEDLHELVRDVFLPVADGIYVANVENGVIHRDLKPDNVLIDSRTLRPYVIDFGICHVLERKSGFASKAVVAPTGVDEGIVGTPRFLAPEQVKGNTHARTDVWGLGATLHYIASGEPPLAGSTPISRIELKRRVAALEATKQAAIDADDERKIDMCEEKLVRMRDPNLRTIDDLFKDARDGKYTELPASTPSPLKAVIKKALAKSTADRYVNARQLGTELQAWLAGSKVRALTQAGGKAAAVESARRAVRTHAVTLLWLLVGLGAGFGLAKLLAKAGSAPPSTRLSHAKGDIDLLNDSLQGLGRVKDSLTAVERRRLWSALDSRAQRIGVLLAEEPDVAQVRSVQERLAYVRSRFVPSRIRIDAPTGTSMRAKDLVTGRDVAVVPGENKLPPGAYQVQVGGSVRFPIEVPLVVRTDAEAAKINTEPALQTYDLGASQTNVPPGMLLVLGGRILPRDLPFNAPSTSAVTVLPFLMDEAEVTNSEYAQFLRSLSADERRQRAPSIAFVPDPEQGGVPIVVKGRDDAPVVGIRAEDALAYAAWRGKQAGATMRLPTEAEWVLAAGGALGYSLPGGKRGHATDADFASPLRHAGLHPEDIGPYGIKGMFGNAREMVTSHLDDLAPGAVLVKGAGVGDDPDQGAIYIHRVLRPDDRHPTTGFRLVRELPGSNAR